MKFLFPALMAGVLAGCVSSPPPRSSELDPSNPEAAASSAWTPQHPPRAEAAPATAAPVTPPPAAAAPAEGEKLYTCPMHPEVISREEGRCPICKMKLVPR